MNQTPILPVRPTVASQPTVEARPTADWLDRRLALVRAGDRIEAELRRVALDVVGRCEHDELDTASKRRLLRVTEQAIEATLEPLTAAFATALARGLDELPEELRDRLTRAEARRDLGLD
jgi:hypothetical protein